MRLHAPEIDVETAKTAAAANQRSEPVQVDIDRAMANESDERMATPSVRVPVSRERISHLLDVSPSEG